MAANMTYIAERSERIKSDDEFSGEYSPWKPRKFVSLAAARMFADGEIEKTSTPGTVLRSERKTVVQSTGRKETTQGKLTVCHWFDRTLAAPVDSGVMVGWVGGLSEGIDSDVTSQRNEQKLRFAGLFSHL